MSVLPRIPLKFSVQFGVSQCTSSHHIIWNWLLNLNTHALFCKLFDSKLLCKLIGFII